MVEYQVMSNSSAVAQQIARDLVRSAVTDVVIAPGSRSAPLVYALAPLAEAGLIRTHVRIDERDAGFLALGLARGRRARGEDRAVAIVTTSGSAVANLHPSVLEASYGHLPLLALTADRPARLRGTGANQTIDGQAHVLSDVRGRFDLPASEAPTAVEAAMSEAVSAALGQSEATGAEAAGPVQLNVQFDAPLVPTPVELEAWTDEIRGWAAAPAGADTTAPAGSSGGASAVAHGPGLDNERAQREVRLTVTDGTVIVAGDAGGHPAETLRELAAGHHLPVLAEPSNPLARSIGGAAPPVPAHARVLGERAELTDAIRTVIVHGKPTLTRPVAALLADAAVHVRRLPDDVDARDLIVTDETSDETLSGPDWVRAWVSAGEAAVAAARAERAAASETASARGESIDVLTSPAMVFEAIAREITESLAAQDHTLFVASSNSVRYLSDATDVRARIHASRGLAGIDGLVSTATGLSLGLEEPVVLLIGDIAMLHDAGGLLTPSAEETGDLTIVVLNDDGGAIFAGLEHSQSHLAGYLNRYFTVPHGRGFAELAAAYGWEHTRVRSAEEFAAAFGTVGERRRGAGAGGRRIIEVAPAR